MAGVDVDVLLPIRDPHPRWFRRALESTLRSRGVAFRVVVVDHGSLVPVVVDDPRVTLVRVDRALTFVGALNAGLASCEAPFVARMDGDDVMHPDRLRLHVAALRDDEAGDLAAVGSRVKILPRGTRAMHGYAAWQNAILDDDDHARAIWIEQPLCHPATTFRRSALHAVGGYVDVGGPEDYDLFLRLSRAGLRIEKLPTVHHGWRQHPDQVTRTRPTQSRDAIAALKARHLVAHYGLAGRAVIVAGAGKEGRRISRALRAHGVFVRAFLDVDPRKIGRTVHGAPVWATTALPAPAAGAFVLGAVGTPGSREFVRAFLRQKDLTEGRDFVIVA